MKKLILILLLIATQMHGQEDSLEIEKIQDFLIKSEGLRVGDGVCFSLVDAAIKQVYKGWRADARNKGGKSLGLAIQKEGLQPGDVIYIEQVNKGRLYKHVGIIVGYSDNDELVVAHQNVGVSSLKDSVVEFWSLSLFELGTDKIEYYRPFLHK